MEKVTGIGGFFFRARNPALIAQWYRDQLGVALVPDDYNHSGWRQESGPTAFTPFPEATNYFGDPAKMWMINFRVRDLQTMVAQLQQAGIKVTVDPKHYPNGRFAHLHDPEGNPIELWQPESRDE